MPHLIENIIIRDKRLSCLRKQDVIQYMTFYVRFAKRIERSTSSILC